MTIRSEGEYRRTKIELEKFEQAIAAARSRPPSPEVDSRVHEAQIEALESELAVLREQLDTTSGSWAERASKTGSPLRAAPSPSRELCSSRRARVLRSGPFCVHE
jgi:hypothetical protein